MEAEHARKGYAEAEAWLKEPPEPLRCEGCPLTAKRDEVIKGLEKVWDAFNHMEHELYADYVFDAIAMLKDHGHGERFVVIDNKTGKEADTYNIALHEDWAKYLCYCDMDGWAIEEDGTLLLVDGCGRSVSADRERFKVVWDA